MDEATETQPQYPVAMSVARAIRKARGYMDPEEDRGQTKLSDLLSLPALENTAERIAYGDRLTEGKGETLRPLNDTTEAAMAVTPFIGPAGKAAAATGKAAVRELGPKVSMMAEGYLQRQGLAPSASAKIRFHMSHTNSYHPGLTIRRILTPCTSITTISR